MNLPHGKENAYKRIGIRAEAIYRGIWWGDQPDDTDINSNEQSEIEAAKQLADKWAGKEQGK